MSEKTRRTTSTRHWTTYHREFRLTYGGLHDSADAAWAEYVKHVNEVNNPYKELLDYPKKYGCLYALICVPFAIPVILSQLTERKKWLKNAEVKELKEGEFYRPWGVSRTLKHGKDD